MSRRVGNGRGNGRGVAQLVADFGHELPPLAPAPARVKDTDPFTVMVGKHGRSRARRRLGSRPRAACGRTG